MGRVRVVIRCGSGYGTDQDRHPNPLPGWYRLVLAGTTMLPEPTPAYQPCRACRYAVDRVTGVCVGGVRYPHTSSEHRCTANMTTTSPSAADPRPAMSRRHEHGESPAGR